VKYPVSFFVIILITICSISKAENLSIVYLDMDKAMNQSIVGKSLKSQLDKIHKANLEEFKINEEDLKKEEVLILSQKNVLSEEDYKNKVNLFKEKLNSYKKKRKKKKKIVKKKQNPKEIKETIKQASEFEKKELFDPNKIAALIDKSKEESAETLKENEKLTQSSVENSFTTGLTLSQEDALKAQIFGCWSLPLGLPYQENLLVRIKLRLKQDGTVLRSEIIDHARMNQPGQAFYKVLAESALRAIRICQPLRVPPTGYEKWKDLQLNFDANEMLKG